MLLVGDAAPWRVAWPSILHAQPEYMLIVLNKNAPAHKNDVCIRSNCSEAFRNLHDHVTKLDLVKPRLAFAFDNHGRARWVTYIVLQWEKLV